MSETSRASLWWSDMIGKATSTTSRFLDLNFTVTPAGAVIVPIAANSFIALPPRTCTGLDSSWNGEIEYYVYGILVKCHLDEIERPNAQIHAIYTSKICSFAFYGSQCSSFISGTYLIRHVRLKTGSKPHLVAYSVLVLSRTSIETPHIVYK